MEKIWFITALEAQLQPFLYEYKNIHKQDSEVIELCLDHRERNKVKGAYNRSLRLEDRSYLMNWWSDFIDNLKAGKD